MQQGADSESEPPRSRSRHTHRHHGLIAHILRIVGLVGEATDAARDLIYAEARLAWAAIPYGIGWFCAAFIFGLSLAACGWAALLYGLVTWTNSLGLALATLALISTILFTFSIMILRRTLRWLGFAQTRQRLASLNRKQRHDNRADPSS